MTEIVGVSAVVKSDFSQNFTKIAEKNFKNLVEGSFNKFAHMTPEEILNYMQSSNLKNIISESNTQAINVATHIDVLRKKINAQDIYTQKSLVNDASLVDTVISITEAKHELSKVIELRNKFVKAWEDILHMAI